MSLEFFAGAIIDVARNSPHFVPWWTALDCFAEPTQDESPAKYAQSTRSKGTFILNLALTRAAIIMKRVDRLSLLAVK